MHLRPTSAPYAITTQPADSLSPCTAPALPAPAPFCVCLQVKTNEKIKRSVLYQKMSPLAPLPLDLQDKDQAATAGRISFGTTGPVTGHEATFMAAEKEDTGRADCAKAMKCVRSCQQELALRKSQLQVSVLNQRAAVLKARRAAKTGKFGSSEDRDTTPGSGGAKHKNPEDAKE